MGRSYTLCASGPLCVVVVYVLSYLLSGLRVKRHMHGSFFSFHLRRIGLPSGDITVTSPFLKTTVQFETKIGPTTISVFVNVRMMYPLVGKSVANCEIGSVDFALDIDTCTFAVPNIICFAVVSS